MIGISQDQALTKGPSWNPSEQALLVKVFWSIVQTADKDPIVYFFHPSPMSPASIHAFYLSGIRSVRPGQNEWLFPLEILAFFPITFFLAQAIGIGYAWPHEIPLFIAAHSQLNACVWNLGVMILTASISIFFLQTNSRKSS